MYRKTVFILVILLPLITSCKEKLFVSLRDTISLDGNSNDILTAQYYDLTTNLSGILSDNS